MKTLAATGSLHLLLLCAVCILGRCRAITGAISLIQDSYEGPAITGTYSVDAGSATFTMELMVPKSYEWVGMHLVSTDFGADVPCVRPNGKFCTEGLEFYMNETTGEVATKFMYTTRFIPDVTSIPERSGLLFDCTPSQEQLDICDAGEAIIATGSTGFGFTTTRQEAAEADFSLDKAELIDDMFHITWSRSLDRPFAGPTIMIRSAAKPRAYQDPLRRIALGMPYHGYGATKTWTMVLSDDASATDDEVGISEEPADECPAGQVRAYSTTTLGVNPAASECGTFCTMEMALGFLGDAAQKGSCKEAGYERFVQVRSVEMQPGAQKTPVAIYVARGANAEAACSGGEVRAFVMEAMGAEAGQCATFCIATLAMNFIAGATEGSCSDQGYSHFMSATSEQMPGSPVAMAIDIFEQPPAANKEEAANEAPDAIAGPATEESGSQAVQGSWAVLTSLVAIATFALIV